MPKYKVLLPTNGYEVGSIVELSEEVAANFNGGEPTPRVELIPEEPAPEVAPAEVPPANEEDQTPPKKAKAKVQEPE